MNRSLFGIVGRGCVAASVAIVLIIHTFGAEAGPSSFYQQDHAFAVPNEIRAYECILGATVFDHYPYEATLSFYVIPSFRPENGMWMYRQHDTYILVTTAAKKNLWSTTRSIAKGSMRFDYVDKAVDLINQGNLIERHQRILDKEMGDRVSAAWKRILYGVRGGQKEVSADGTLLVFRSYSRACGRVSWDVKNPPLGSVAAVLYKTAKALQQFANTGDVHGMDRCIESLEAVSKEFPAHRDRGSIRTGHP